MFSGISLLQKVIFNLEEIFILIILKIVAILPECSRLEQRSFIKHLVIEKCKQREINKRLYDVYGEAFCCQNIFTHKLNMGLSLWAWVEKTVHGVETHWISGKEKVLGEAVSK